MENLEIKVCKVCGPQKTDLFYVSYIAKNGKPVYKDVCKPCYIKRNKEKRSPEIDKKRLHRAAIKRAQGIGHSANLLRSYKTGDKARGRNCDLTKEFIEEKISNGCSYCGERDIRLLGLDRVYNDLGHLKMNVVPACQRCNTLRRDMPYEAWLLFVPVIKDIISRDLFGDWYPRQAMARKKLLEAESLEDNRFSDKITEETILEDADRFFQQHGFWPKTNSSFGVPDKSYESWTHYDIYLSRGQRGLPGGSTLAKLLQKERGVQNPKGKPRLTEDIILYDIQSFYNLHGRLPNKRETLPVPGKPLETWSGYNSALYGKTRGISERSSLCKLIEKRMLCHTDSSTKLSLAC